MVYTEKELLKKKEDIQKAKNKLAELKGEEKGLLKQLQDLGCNNLEEAKESINQLSEDIDEINKRIEKTSLELEKYE